jgi:hypothetical protein
LLNNFAQKAAKKGDFSWVHAYIGVLANLFKGIIDYFSILLLKMADE